MNIEVIINSFIEWVQTYWVDIFTTIITALVIYLIGAKLLSVLIRRAVAVNGKHNVWHAKDIEKRQNTLLALARNVWRIVVAATLTYALLRTVFPDISGTLAPLFASAGIIGIALGFGAQSLIKDFLSGIFIISENQYRVGDVVDLDGASGTVERIGTRSTMLRDVDGNVHFIPNGMIMHIINKTYGYSKARVIVAVQPNTDIDKATAIIDGIGEAMASEDGWKDKIIETPKYVMMGELTAMSVELIVSSKVQPSDQWTVSAELRRRILQEFEAKGIELGLNATTTAVAQKKPRRAS